MAELAWRRGAAAQRGRWRDYFTIVWNMLEGLAAVIARSISFGALGMDSFIEVASSAALLWRINVGC